MNPRLRLPLSLILVLGVTICFIPRVRKDEAPAPAPRKTTPVFQTNGVLGNTKVMPRSEPKKETKPAAPLTPEEEEAAAAGRASDMAKMFIRYAADHQGALPPDLSALIGCGLMDHDRAGEYLKSVIDYRGADLTNRDSAKLTVMRYRIGKRTDKELRSLLSGSVYFCDPADPIPEDEANVEPTEKPLAK